MGKPFTKLMLYNEKDKLNKTKTSLHFKPSYICIEDPFVLDHNVGSCFRESNKYHWFEILETVVKDLNINPNNCVEVITNPENFSYDGLITE